MTRRVFDEGGEFAASRAAEAWCEANGYSVGPVESGRSRGLRKGAVVVAEWTSLRQADKDSLDGVMTGDMRRGPVVVHIND